MTHLLAQLVFVSRLLGLMTGTRDVEVQVDAQVASVEIQLDRKPVTTLRGVPWKTRIDFGVELIPHELTAVARDAEDREVARDTQFINLARPLAEVGALFRRHEGNLLADIRWQHLASALPTTMTVKLDGKRISGVVARTINLKDLSTDVLHVLDVEMQFKDGVTARKEIVFGGVTEEMPAELTPIVVRLKANGRTDLERCFTIDGRPVAASAVEEATVSLLFVRDPDNATAASQLLARRELNRRPMPELAFHIPDAAPRFVWPVAQGAAGADMFATSGDFEETSGIRWLLGRVVGPAAAKPRMTDAVAVAGSESLQLGRRRMVVLVLGREQDASRYRPATVRRYLQSIGVPLRVWSLTGGARDAQWGEVENVSSPESLRDAVDRLRRDLSRQRVVWLPLTPFDSLRVATPGDCAWEPLAKE